MSSEDPDLRRPPERRYPWYEVVNELATEIGVTVNWPAMQAHDNDDPVHEFKTFAAWLRTRDRREGRDRATVAAALDAAPGQLGLAERRDADRAATALAYLIRHGDERPGLLDEALRLAGNLRTIGVVE